VAGTAASIMQMGSNSTKTEWPVRER